MKITSICKPILILFLVPLSLSTQSTPPLSSKYIIFSDWLKLRRYRPALSPTDRHRTFVNKKIEITVQDGNRYIRIAGSTHRLAHRIYFVKGNVIIEKNDFSRIAKQIRFIENKFKGLEKEKKKEKEKEEKGSKPKQEKLGKPKEEKSTKPKQEKNSRPKEKQQQKETGSKKERKGEEEQTVLPILPDDPFPPFTNSGVIDKIFIDAGHGGKDPGAVSYSIMEKDLCLSASLELAKKLQKKLPSVKVILTRTNDTFLELEQRSDFANRQLKKHENGLFISIHFNIWINPDTSGFEVYYLAHTHQGEKSRIMAERENLAVREKDHPEHPISVIEEILARFKVIQYQKESKYICELVEKEVAESKYGSINRGTKADNFYVLKASLMPSILIEMGFISNVKDMEFFNSKEKRDLLIDSITAGIAKYVEEFKKNESFQKSWFK